MGIVYLVQAGTGLGALKLIRPQLADDQEFRARFRREVEAGRAVAGRYTARFIDAELDGAAPYLVTEYVDGPSLAEAVAEGGPFAFDAVVGLASGLAEALQSIHAAGVIHRDLKPSNILLGPTGPRIIDFGIARAMEATSITQTGMSVGSPPWMAPEAARGEPISPATDVFAWGGAVVFAATGRAPFGEGRPEAVLYRIVHETPDLDGLDPRLLPVVHSALDRDPAARLSVSGLKEAVHRAAGVETPDPKAITTAVMSRTERIGPEDRPDFTEPMGRSIPGGKRIAVVSAVAILLLVAVGAGVLAASLHHRGIAAHNPPGSGTTHRTTTTPPTTAATTTTMAPTTTTSAPHTTQIQVFTPFSESGGLSQDVRVTGHNSGYCWTGSLAVDDPNAWRCFIGANDISDPCFSSPWGTMPGYVACGGPFTGVILLKLTKALPFALADQAPPSIAEEVPFLLKLANGDDCGIDTGTAPVIAGMRMDFGCTGGALAGPIDNSSQPWTVELIPQGGDVGSPQPIAVIWDG